MHDVQCVDVIDSCNDLLEKFAGFNLWDAFMFDNIVEQLSIVCIFHYQVKFLGRFDYFIQLNDVWVTD